MSLAATSPRAVSPSGWLSGAGALAALAFALLFVFLVAPVVSVLYAAFTDRAGAFTLINVADFFRNDLFMTSLMNSVWVSAMAVALATALATPLALITTRYDFRGSALVQTLGVLPLIMPPFAGAVAMQLLFGRNGSLNLLLGDWFDINIPFMEGLNGVILLQGLHYFPFLLLNLSASLANIDRSMEEAAQNLGASGFRLFRRILFPLAMPGYIAGASLVFIKVFDDLATPLLLNVKDMLAPQAYLRITALGLADPMGYVIATVLIVVSLLAMGVAGLATRGRDYATTQRGGGGLLRKPMTRAQTLASWLVIALILAIALSPHVGLLLLSFATVWSFSPLPDGYTLAHYARIFGESGGYILNTLLYATLAGVIAVALGTLVAWIVQRTKTPGRVALDYLAMAALAVPGVVIGIGYLRAFYGVTLPGGHALATFWGMIVVALAIRRLPYALRASTASLQQIAPQLEEAAENLGASRPRAVRRILLPLMTSGMLAGFVTAFATASVELSATMMLVQSNADAPLAYGLYVFMQSPAGRGAGAALGVVAVVIVGLCALVSNLVAGHDRAASMGH